MGSLGNLLDYGQSFWLDYIRRDLITSGELRTMIEQDGLRGITSNPTIFQKAVAGSSVYDDEIAEIIKKDSLLSVDELYEKLTIRDIQMAADVLRTVYDETNCADGFVSYELSPLLAYDTEGSIAEARRLWKTIDRPNVMLKVPATPEGIPVVEVLLSEGINVNVTLIFSLATYEKVAHAYIRGLKKCSNPKCTASVASFFLSRIDVAVDKALEQIGSPQALELRGKIAVASARIAYNCFEEIFSGELWRDLAKKGARVQRLLWASTSTKNPEYPDLLYVEGLIGRYTINTMPPVTISAFKDHGRASSTLEETRLNAELEFQELEDVGVDLDEITGRLLVEGVTAFASSFESLLSTLEEKQNALSKTGTHKHTSK